MHWETVGRSAEIHRDELAREAAAYRLAASARGSVRTARIPRRPALHGVLGVLRMVFRRQVIEVARMAKFIDIHSGFMGVTPTQLREAHERDLAIEADEGVHFERTWLDAETGKVFCLSSGPTREAVMRIHERAGHPSAEVYEISSEVA